MSENKILSPQKNSFFLFKLKDRLSFHLSYSSFAFLIAIYFGFVLNLPLMQEFLKVTSESNSGSFLFLLTIPILLTAAFNLIFQLFSFPYIRKPIFIILVITSSLASFAAFNYGIIFDYGMIENIFETNLGEAESYLNLTSVISFILTGLIPSLLILFSVVKLKSSLLKELLSRLISIIASLIAISLIALFFYKDYASIGRNNSYLNKVIVPTHVYSTYKYIKKTYLTKPLIYRKLGLNAKLEPSLNAKPMLLFLVIGETARSMNIGYNGYPRDTNPYTSSSDLISFQSVSSCGTATAYSVPCMFSNLNRSNYNRALANSQDNVLDIMQRAGVSIIWNENDGGSKGVTKNIPMVTIDKKIDPVLCDGSSCLDEVMLKNLDRQINKMKGDKMIAFHIMGSHGPTYWKRYPKETETFLPACNRSDIENCTNEEIVNTYDNTIIYTDYFLSKLISHLKSLNSQYNTALMYLSDHGESLGENGLYLHGTPYSLAPKEQTHVPWFMWLSEQYAKNKDIDKECLKDKATNSKFSQDYFFHTLLGFAGVKTKVKNENFDITATCNR